MCRESCLCPFILRRGVKAGLLLRNVKKELEVFLQQLLNGLSCGGVYALMAVGFGLIYNVLKFSNFSHGGVMLIGCYTAYFAFKVFHSSLFVTLLFGAIVGGLCAVIFEKLAIAPLRKRNAPKVYFFVNSINGGLLSEYLIVATVGVFFHTFPDFLGTTNINIGQISFSKLNLTMFTISLITLFGLMWYLYKTKSGRAIRAVACDINTASLMGVDVNRVISLTFFVSGLLGGLSGVFLGINYTIYPQLGKMIVKGWMASVIGGLGSLLGPVVGGILLGVLETFLTAYIGSSFTPILSFIILLMFLLIRPQGIAGIIVEEKV